MRIFYFYKHHAMRLYLATGLFLRHAVELCCCYRGCGISQLNPLLNVFDCQEHHDVNPDMSIASQGACPLLSRVSNY